MTTFAHLAARTSYSLRDGVLRPKELAAAVVERGMDTIGVADRGGLYGAVRMAQACAAQGVKLVLGTDLALDIDSQRAGWQVLRGAHAVQQSGNVDKRPRPASGPASGPKWLEDGAARVLLIAVDQAGYARMTRTVSDHHLESDRGAPHLTWEQATRRLGNGGVQVLLGDGSPVARLLDAGRPDAAAAETRRWMALVGPDAVAVAVTHHLAPGDDDRARSRFALADQLGLRAVAHQAPRYLTPSDARIADVMDAVRGQVPLSKRHSGRRNTEGYLKSPDEMARVFAERPDALTNAAALAAACNVDMQLGASHVPDFVGIGEHALTELRHRCEAGLRERYAHPGQRHNDLLADELAMIERLGLASYFLTVAEIVERMREKGIMASCRGSAAGSLVVYTLRISDVDPIAHDLVYERFMNPYRDELPDIDIDVESARREDIYRDLLDRYGSDRVACVCMVDTFKARMAIREVGKALGLPAGEVDYVAKSFPHVRAGDVRPALAHLPELSGLNLDKGQLGLLFDVVERMDGLPRHLALHPSGVLLADTTLRDFVPLESSAAGFAMAQFDKDDVEALGLCKLDVLSVRMLSSIAHCREEVRRVRGIDLDFDRVPWNDEPTFELIRSTRTLGMFQIESPGQRELVGKFQPEHLGDLVVDISLFRPGPVKGDMIGPFLQRRLGQAKTVYPHPLLERALGETFGVIVYHEQVMRCVQAVTDCDLSTADLVRRRLGDPTRLELLHDWIIAGARARGLDDKVAESLWVALAQFASFGFCKAHAAAFSVPTYRSAWLKTHYCPEFMAGLLTHDPGMYPRRLLLDDARQFGIAVLPLDVNRSPRDYRVERLPAEDAYTLLGVRQRSVEEWELPRGWRCDDGVPMPPAGFDFGCETPPPVLRTAPADPGLRADPAAVQADDGELVAKQPPDTHGGWRFGIRLALQDVADIDDRMIDSLVAGRPFLSIEDLRRRAVLSAPVAQALTHAGALDDIGGVGCKLASGRVRSRRDLLLDVTERWSGLSRHRPSDPPAPQQLGLLPDENEDSGLVEYRDSERVRAELEVLGIDASMHVIRFYDGLLDIIGVHRVVDLAATRNGQRVRVAGVKVATQTPPVKSGQRIIFLSLDDGTGVSDATFFESVHDRCAWTVFHTWLLVVEGTVHRTGKRGISINAEAVWDLRRLMHAWRDGWLDAAIAEQGRPGDQAGRNFSDGAPSGIHGAHGRSGLRLPDGQIHTPAAALRVPRNAPHGSSRIGPNGTTWADPAGRHPGVDLQDVARLSPNDPRHPDHPDQPPGPSEPDQPAGPSRKLWHASSGSSGR